MAKRGFNGALMRLTQARDHLATAVSKEQLTQNFVRVHLRSDTLFEDVELVPKPCQLRLPSPGWTRSSRICPMAGTAGSARQAVRSLEESASASLSLGHW